MELGRPLRNFERRTEGCCLFSVLESKRESKRSKTEVREKGLKDQY